MWPGVVFSIILTGLLASIGVTHSYSSCPFLCYLGTGLYLYRHTHTHSCTAIRVHPWPGTQSWECDQTESRLYDVFQGRCLHQETGLWNRGQHSTIHQCVSWSHSQTTWNAVWEWDQNAPRLNFMLVILLYSLQVLCDSVSLWKFFITPIVTDNWTLRKIWSGNWCTCGEC